MMSRSLAAYKVNPISGCHTVGEQENREGGETASGAGNVNPNVIHWIIKQLGLQIVVKGSVDIERKFHGRVRWSEVSIKGSSRLWGKTTRCSQYFNKNLVLTEENLNN